MTETKKEFEIGDKVVVLTGSKESAYNHRFTKGAVGVVTGLDYGDLWVQVEGIYSQVLRPSELELANV